MVIYEKKKFNVDKVSWVSQGIKKDFLKCTNKNVEVVGSIPVLCVALSKKTKRWLNFQRRIISNENFSLMFSWNFPKCLWANENFTNLTKQHTARISNEIWMKAHTIAEIFSFNYKSVFLFNKFITILCASVPERQFFSQIVGFDIVELEEQIFCS